MSSRMRKEDRERATAKRPITDGEREILFQIQQLQAKWIDTVQMCLSREVSHRQRIEELAKNVRDLTTEIQELKQQLTKDRLF